MSPRRRHITRSCVPTSPTSNPSPKPQPPQYLPQGGRLPPHTSPNQQLPLPLVLQLPRRLPAFLSHRLSSQADQRLLDCLRFRPSRRLRPPELLRQLLLGAPLARLGTDTTPASCLLPLSEARQGCYRSVTVCPCTHPVATNAVGLSAVSPDVFCCLLGASWHIIPAWL